MFCLTLFKEKKNHKCILCPFRMYEASGEGTLATSSWATVVQGRLTHRVVLAFMEILKIVPLVGGALYRWSLCFLFVFFFFYTQHRHFPHPIFPHTHPHTLSNGPTTLHHKHWPSRLSPFNALEFETDVPLFILGPTSELNPTSLVSAWIEQLSCTGWPQSTGSFLHWFEIEKQRGACRRSWILSCCDACCGCP